MVTATNTYGTTNATSNSTGIVGPGYATLDPANTGPGYTLSNGNLTLTHQLSPSGWLASRSTVSVSSGSWYWEVTVNANNNGGSLLV
jgi:hypothetical protein